MPGPVDLLWPPPLVARAGGARWDVPARPRVRPGPLAATDPAVRRLERALRARGAAPHPVGQGPADIVLAVDAALGGPPESYRLVVDPFGARVEAPTARGAAHGATTLAQWIALAERRAVRELVVRDEPGTAVRGAILDISRCRVPTMETLERRLERLAAWKGSRLELYTEHTFAYAGHEAVWRGCDPLSPDEVRRLDDAADERGIELAPNQQSFGHLHRFLRLPRYRELAECPEGVVHPFSDAVEPFSLDPTSPKALEFLAGLYRQLLACFRSRTLNAGLDETFDLGLGRSRERCERLGKHAVYLEFVGRVRKLLAAHYTRLEMWADVLLEAPEQLGALPRDVVPIVWGYEADFDFRAGLGTLAEAGFAPLAAPGTSSWQSFVGRPSHAFANVLAAAKSLAGGLGEGLLVTDWGDRGHHQVEPASELGLLLAAGAAWRPEAVENLDEERTLALLARHAFEEHTPRLSRSLIELGRAGEQALCGAQNGNAPFFLVSYAHEPLPSPRLAGLAPRGLEAARERVAAARASIDASASAREDAALVAEELRLAADLVTFGLDLGLARLAAAEGAPLEALPARTRRELAERLAELTARHRRLWIERSRPGGLDESAAWFERVVAALDPRVAEADLSGGR